MVTNINRVALLLLWLSCPSLSTDVHQGPSSILWNPHSSATISCNHSVSTYNQILWYQQPVGDSGLKLIGYVYYTDPTVEDPFKQHFNVTGDGSAKSQLHVLKLRQPEDSGLYYCAARGNTAFLNANEAYFGKGTKLTVLENNRDPEPPTVKVLPPSSKECRNKKDSKRKKTLVCVASKFYPDHVSVSWQIDGENVTEGVATDDAALRPAGERYYRITSRLRVPAESWFTPAREFKCLVKFYNGNDYEIHEDSINGVEAPATGNAITREKYLRVTQTAKLSYAVFIVKSSIYGAFVAFLVWKLQGKQNN